MVHTSAPGRGRDDTRYRALAQAFLDFQPATQIRLDNESQDSRRQVLVSSAESQLQEGLLHSTQESRESRASYRPDGEDEGNSGSRTSSSQQNSSRRPSIPYFVDSPSLSFRSVLDNANSPFQGKAAQREHVLRTPEGLAQSQKSAAFWERPPSSVADSQPENEAGTVAFCSPTRVLESYLQERTKTNSTSSPALSRQKLRRDCLPALTSSPVLESEHIHTQSSPSPQKRPPPECVSIPPPKHEVIPRMAQKRKLPESIPQTSTIGDIFEASSNKLPRPSNATAQDISSARNPLCDIIRKSATPSFGRTEPSDWSHVNEIRPSPPPISIDDLRPEQLITNDLKFLANKMKLRVLPSEQARELRPMERGYWLVECGKWDENIQRRCWDVLGDYIGGDRAGWGVSCIRIPETPGVIRIYCWGIVVEHIYMVLYMASASKIKGTGACWIGGDGRVIIKMPS